MPPAAARTGGAGQAARTRDLAKSRWHGRVAGSVEDPRALLAIRGEARGPGACGCGRPDSGLSERRLRSAKARGWIASYHAPLSDTATRSSRCTLLSSFTRPGAHQSSALSWARYAPTSNSGCDKPQSVCLAFGWQRAHRLTESCAIAQYRLLQHGPLRCADHSLSGSGSPDRGTQLTSCTLQYSRYTQKQQAPRAQPSL